MPQRDGQFTGVPGADAHATQQLAGDGCRRQRQRHGQRGRMRQDSNVGAKTDQHEEDRNEKRRHRLQHLVERALAAADEHLRMDVFEDEAGGEGADERRQSDRARGPRHEETEAEADREERTRRSQSCRPPKPRRA